jgi:hypothetical protein
MKVVNIDSPYMLTAEQIAFTKEVIVYGEDPTFVKPDSLTCIMDRVPVFLFSAKTFEKCFDKEPKIDEIEYERPQKTDTEYLGVYIHNAKIFCSTIPAIGLCPERFLENHQDSEIKNNETSLKYCIAKVLVHEFAHALMHRYPYFDDKKYSKSPVYKWKEESMANAITLRYFRFYSQVCKSMLSSNRKLQISESKERGCYEYAREFINLQPPQYKFGLYLHDENLDNWWYWRNNKAKIVQNIDKYMASEKLTEIDLKSKNYSDLTRILKCDKYL